MIFKCSQCSFFVIFVVSQLMQCSWANRDRNQSREEANNKENCKL